MKIVIDILKNIATIIVCHVVGDYLFQTDYMAREKKNSYYVLFVHCVCYCVPFMYVFGLDWRILVLFISHLIIDYGKCKEHLNLFVDQMEHYYIALILFSNI